MSQTNGATTTTFQPFIIVTVTNFLTVDLFYLIHNSPIPTLNSQSQLSQTTSKSYKPAGDAPHLKVILL